MTAGTNLTAPEAGAIEFDGNDLFITLSNGRRRFLTSTVANVLDFGAKGDGSNDDAQAFRDAVTSLVDTGGVVWVPPGLIYTINSSIDIPSNYPIFIESRMYLPRGIGYIHAPSETGYIRPGADITEGLFHCAQWTE